MRYFSSDWHLDHKRIIELSDRPFKDLSEMNETIITNMLAPLKPNDTFYFLGDLGFSKEIIVQFLERVPKGVEFVWIIGNHDEKFLPFFKGKMTYMEFININKKEVTLCHYPMKIWRKSNYNSWSLFGHAHINERARQFKPYGKMINVNCELHDYKPWTEDEIITEMRNRPDNLDCKRKKR